MFSDACDPRAMQETTQIGQSVALSRMARMGVKDPANSSDSENAKRDSKELPVLGGCA